MASRNVCMCCLLKRIPHATNFWSSGSDNSFISVIKYFTTSCHSLDFLLSHGTFPTFYWAMEHSQLFPTIQKFLLQALCKLISLLKATLYKRHFFSINPFKDILFDWPWNILTLLKNYLYKLKSHFASSLIKRLKQPVLKFDFRLFTFPNILFVGDRALKFIYFFVNFYIPKCFPCKLVVQFYKKVVIFWKLLKNLKNFWVNSFIKSYVLPAVCLWIQYAWPFGAGISF